MNSDVCRSASTSVVFPAPDGAERTNKIPVRVNRLLKVLNLLSNFFELGFAHYDALRNARVIRLCTKRVQFAKNFLSDELECTADRFVTAKMMGKLREMTLDAREFFRNVRTNGKESHLFDE